MATRQKISRGSTKVPLAEREKRERKLRAISIANFRKEIKSSLGASTGRNARESISEWFYAVYSDGISPVGAADSRVQSTRTL